MSTAIPCRRCHRLRPVNSAGYCGGCSTELRAMEQRRPASDAVTVNVLTPSLAPPPDEPSPSAASTLPPPDAPTTEPPAAAAAAPPATDPDPPAAVPLSPVIPAFMLPNLDEETLA